MSLEEVKEWLYGCTRCGTCKEVLNLCMPSCPAGEKYQLESYFPSGKLFIGRAVLEGTLTLADDDTLERIYACTGCRSCEQQCGVYHHEHIFESIQAIRTEAVTRGFLNPAYMVMVDGLRRDDNVFGKPKAERGAWAENLEVKDATRERVDVLYHAGCMLSFERELWGVPRSTIMLLKTAGVDVGVMGREEACCGGRAYEIGYLGEFTKYAQHCMETFNALGASQVVTSCSDGYSTFKSLYPKVEGKMNFDVLHMVEYLDQLIKEGRIKFGKELSRKVTYHDPCHLGRHVSPGVYQPPRDILESIPGVELVEMERIRENSWCCGAGGGVKEACPELALWTARERISEAIATGADTLVTACPWCERNFKDAIEESGVKLDILDIVELASEAI